MPGISRVLVLSYLVDPIAPLQVEALRSHAPVVTGLRTFLGGWLGIGRIVVGMARHGYDLQLTRYGDEGWRTTFYPAGRGHSATSAVGSAWEREPWIAVQRAAWESLRKREAEAT